MVAEKTGTGSVPLGVAENPRLVGAALGLRIGGVTVAQAKRRRPWCSPAGYADVAAAYRVGALPPQVNAP